MTDPTATTTEDSRSTAWHARPFLLAVVAVMVLADLVIVLRWWDTAGQREIYLFLGLFFGQAGAVSARAFAKGVEHRLLVAVGSLVLGGVLATFCWLLSSGPEPSTFIYLYVLLFLEYQVAVLVALLVIQLIQRRATSSPWRPQFVVRQLLAIMIVTALVATVIRSAMEDIGALANPEIIALVATSATITILAAILLMNHRPTLWRLGAFAGLGLGVGYVGSEFVRTGHLPYLLVAQMAALAVCLVVPQLDRHQVRVAVEPRDSPTNEEHLDENA